MVVGRSTIELKGCWCCLYSFHYSWQSIYYRIESTTHFLINNIHTTLCRSTIELKVDNDLIERAKSIDVGRSTIELKVNDHDGSLHLARHWGRSTIELKETP